VEAERRTVEADLGPVRYLATLLGANDEDVLRYFILVVALLLDLPPRRCSWQRRGHGRKRQGARRRAGARQARRGSKGEDARPEKRMGEAPSRHCYKSI
jgi:hypothetical protein